MSYRLPGKEELPLKVGIARPTFRRIWKKMHAGLRFLAPLEYLAAWFFFLFNNVALLRFTIQAGAAALIIYGGLGVAEEFKQRKADRSIRVATLFAQIADIQSLSGETGLWAIRSSVEALAREHVSMEGIDLRGTVLRGVTFQDAILVNGVLSGTNLIDANLRNANLGNADLSCAVLGNSVLIGANLNGADLSNAVFSNAGDPVKNWEAYKAIRAANERCADFRNAVVADEPLSAAELNDADLSGAVLNGAVLEGTDLSGAVLKCAVLRGADLSNAILRGANLSNAVLSSSLNRPAMLRHHPTRSNVLIKCGRLSHAIFNDASYGPKGLRGADLSGADLAGADLSNADFSDVDLDGANLDGANISGANLRTVRNLEKFQLVTACAEPGEQPLLPPSVPWTDSPCP